MREAVGEARIEDDGEPVGRIGDAVVHLVAGRRLHPAIGRKDPECRDRRAERDRDAGEHMQPARHAVAAEQQDAEEGRLQEERGQHLVADQRPDHIADDRREAAPVGAELVGQHDARDDAHRERHGENLGPERREPREAAPLPVAAHSTERGDIGRERRS